MKHDQALHGFDISEAAPPGGVIPGQPSVGTDPTQGKGTPAWQQALRMGLSIQARQRRN